MKLSLRVAAALLLGVALFAFPLASPVPDPGERLRLEVQPADTDRNYTADRTYESLSADAKALFDAAAPNGTAGTSLADAPEPWATQARNHEPNSASSDVVERDGVLYLVFPFRHSPGPSGTDVLARLGALAAGAALLGYAGYTAVNSD